MSPMSTGSASTLVLVLSALALSVAGGAFGSSRIATQAHFRSPSGNINCYLQDGRGTPPFVDCLVVKNRWRTLPSKPRSCDVDFYPAEIALGATGRTTIGSCRGDVGPSCLPRSGFGCTMLAYGRAITTRHFVCRSAQNGITCLVRGRARRLGFRIARERYVVYR